MKPQLLLLVFVNHVFMVGEAMSQCANKEEFDQNAKKLFNKDDMSTQIEKSGVKIGSEENGSIREIVGFENLVAMMSTFYAEKKEIQLRRELTMLRRVCGQTEADYKGTADCQSKIIPYFYGCFTHGRVMFLIKEKMGFNLDDLQIQSAFEKLSPLNKIRIMLDIVDKYIELHKLNIVHNDVRPASIVMKNKDFTDFRIINLHLSANKGEDYILGTDGYRPIETYYLDEKVKTMDFVIDIYALGLTFIEITGDFVIQMDYFQEKCFKGEDKIEKCSEKLKQGIHSIFTEKRNLISLVPIIKKAVDFESSLRFQSMEEFANALISNFLGRQGVRVFLNKLFEAEKKNESASNFPSYWRTKVAPYLIDLNIAYEEKKKSTGILKSLGNALIGDSSEEEEKFERIIL